ncbi:TIGR00730 family Rossman fold protein [Virgisporangium ochraceum]|uniref:Cytokinin riboside 5'-monophosphate phosphoribohydrolase n=1 Tax=Virgisporangium ochraceum TaxID=65505 RepID=A0A8J3ZZB3_9ACTN|nr:TIGR00730 family Rossman fold protein [Virgisporangium ochraceum]GIJ70235.1 cytokinin riboside 5'-monophosphate phosphoribohydrolase [Virgisporangium ochraceum]
MAAICVFCASSSRIDERWMKLATEVGTAIGRRGHSLVSGGACVGMMGALGDGARAAGAHTLGIIPQSLVDIEVADRASDELVVTSGMFERKSVMIDRADAFLTLPGGLGTLDELFEVWTTATLRIHDKPIVLLDADGFYGGLVDWLAGLTAQHFTYEGAMDRLHVVPTVDTAFDLIESLLP